MTDSDYQYEFVWQNLPETTKEEVVKFWVDEGALPNEDMAQERAKQLIYVIRNKDGDINGVSTIYEQHNEQLRNQMYYMRAFVPERFRESGIQRNVILKVRDYLNDEYVAGNNTKSIGLMLEVSDPAIQKQYDDAIWEDNGMVFIGKNPAGAHQRVYYFTDATL